jgi:hypothetical protein
MLRRLGWHYIRIHAFELFADPEAVATRVAALIGVEPTEDEQLTGPIDIPQVINTADSGDNEVVEEEITIELRETVVIEQVGDTVVVEDIIEEDVTITEVTSAPGSEPDAITAPIDLPEK